MTPVVAGVKRRTKPAYRNATKHVLATRSFGSTAVATKKKWLKIAATPAVAKGSASPLNSYVETANAISDKKTANLAQQIVLVSKVKSVSLGSAKKPASAVMVLVTKISKTAQHARKTVSVLQDKPVSRLNVSRRSLAGMVLVKLKRARTA